MDLSFLNRYHLILKTHYFLFFSSFGNIFPILNLVLRSHGLSNTEISLTNIILPFLVFFFSPLVGFFADKSGRFLLTFNLILIITTLTLTSLFFLPLIKSQHIQADLTPTADSYEYILDFCASQEIATKCSSRSNCGCSYRAYCRNNQSIHNFTFTMNSPEIKKELKNHCGIHYHIPIEVKENFSKICQCEITCSIPYFCHGLRYNQQMIYILSYSFLYIIGTTLLSIANAVGASIGFASLTDGKLFGKQRVWGTIGFGISAFLTSQIYEIFHSEYVYVIFYLASSILTMIVTCFIPLKKPNKNDDEKKPKINFSKLISLFKNFDILIFLSIAFLWGMCFGCMQPYLLLYIDELAPCQSRSVIGYMSLISAASEVIAFYVANRVIKYFGTNLTSILIFLSFAIRFFGYYFITKPYLFLPFELMHFFNFGILYVVIAQKAETIAPPGLSGTLQGVAHGFTHGLGRGIGMLVSSFIYIVIQQRVLFLVFANLNILGAIVYSIYFYLTRNKSSSTTNQLDKTLHDQSLVLSPMLNTNEEKN